MSKAQKQAMERLAVKLSALRKTLRGEERALLDRMVLSAQAEVSLHSVKVAEKAAETKATGAQARAEVKYRSSVQGKHADKARSEVGLHAANVKAKTADKSHSEVELHSSKVEAQQADSATQGATMGKLMRSSTEAITAEKVMRITMDRKRGAYMVVVE